MLTRTPCEQVIPLLLSLPIGNIWARYVPNVTFFGVELNPGPFTIKEHVIITIMASIGSEPAYVVSTTQFRYTVDLAVDVTLSRLGQCDFRPKGYLPPES